MPDFVHNEAEAIQQLLVEGAHTIHIRKPNATVDAVRGLLHAIHPSFYNKLVMHYYPQLVEEFNLLGFHFNKSNVTTIQSFSCIHKSYSAHSFTEVLEMQQHSFNYIFLSPLFNSISKEGYAASFSTEEVKMFISSAPRDINLVALGGIDATNIEQVQPIGFKGVAVLGSVWTDFAIHASVDKVVQQFQLLQHK